jgi:hypothetical protein
MDLRERHHDERASASPSGGAGAPGAQSFRANAERLLAQGGDAIDRALSEDSTAFLAANRQVGGQ